MGMLSLIAIVPLLGEVAKVDIRATGPVTNEGALKGMLSTAYAGAGIGGAGTIIPASDMTLNAATPGHFVLEVSTSYATAAQLDAYWCVNDPALRNHFKDLVVLGTGLSDVTDVITCVGASGEGCASSTPCGGGGGGGDTSDPAPEPEPAPTGGGDDDDDGGGLSTTAIVLIVIGSVLVVGALLYLLWPMLASLCKGASAPASDAAVAMNPTPERVPGTELPPLLTPA